MRKLLAALAMGPAADTGLKRVDRPTSGLGAHGRTRPNLTGSARGSRSIRLR